MCSRWSSTHFPTTSWSSRTQQLNVLHYGNIGQANRKQQTQSNLLYSTSKSMPGFPSKGVGDCWLSTCLSCPAPQAPGSLTKSKRFKGSHSWHTSEHYFNKVWDDTQYSMSIIPLAWVVLRHSPQLQKEGVICFLFCFSFLFHGN